MIRSFADTKLPENQLVNVEFKELKTHRDDRGFFREIIRENDSIFAGHKDQASFGQWSHSKMSKNTVKAWHYHHLQYDWWYIGLGVVSVVLVDFREESPTYQKKIEFKLGDSEVDSEALQAVLGIPPGIIHGCKCLTEFAHLFYITNRVYDPNDEGRYPFNSPIITHDWGNESELIVAPNDRKTIVPSSPRRDFF